MSNNDGRRTTAYGLGIKAALLLVAAPFISWKETYGQSNARSPNAPLINLRFSSRYSIDKINSQQDRFRPLFFNLHGPAEGRASSSERYGYTADVGTEFETWLDKRVPCSSAAGNERSLAIKITSKIDENAKDKIMISPISHQESKHLSVMDADNTRFFSFDFMLDPAYEVPHNWALHFQAWQCCAGHPPFVIAVSERPDKLAPVEFSFEVRNDATELEKFGQATSIYKTVIRRGIWHTIVLELQPRAIGSPAPGKIGIWVDGEKKKEWLGFWGFAPNPSSQSARGPVKDNIGLDLGVYRRRQITAQTILFDNISLASTMSSIARYGSCATGDER